MNKKYSVSIGIPIYNEEKNIKILLESLLVQKMKKGFLKQIIIVSDGSTDKTVELINTVKDPRIILINRKSRKGTNYSQNEIIKIAREDILVFINGDVIPSDNNFIEKMIAPIIKDSNVGLVGGDVIGAKPNTFIESIIFNSHNLKTSMSKKFNNGNNIYLCYGGARAFSKTFYSQITWPLDVPEDAYSYLLCLQNGFSFKYAKQAKIIIRIPATLNDHKKQSTRFMSGKRELYKYFPSTQIEKSYQIPKNIFLSTLLSFLIHKPISTLLYLAITIYLRAISSQYIFTSKWDPSVSSKEVVI